MRFTTFEEASSYCSKVSASMVTAVLVQCFGFGNYEKKGRGMCLDYDVTEYKIVS